MKKILKSVYSDSTRFYVSNPYPEIGEKIDVKLRMIKNTKVDKVFVRYKKLGMEILKEMDLIETKNSMNYYQGQIECHEDLLSYHFYIVSGNNIYFYNQAGVTSYLPDESRDFKILVNYKGPAWMSKTVFYQIMTDRFYNARPDLTIEDGAYTYQGHKPYREEWTNEPKEYDDSHCMDFYGGDLYGIIEKLDYLQDLGVNGLYLNPIFTSPTMHKYDALDYFEIDPSLGGDKALEELTKEVHKRGMKIILDISVNHTSSAAKWFNKSGEFYPKEIGAYNNPESQERSYYFISEDGSYESWFDVETMPSLDYSNGDVRRIIYKAEDSVLKKWLNPPYNIDGWRFDVADVMARSERVNVYHEVWEDIARELKKTNEESLILAEDWTDASEMYDGKKWDSTMNYFQSARPIREFAGEGDLFIIRNQYLKEIPYRTTGEDLKNRILSFLNKTPSQIQYQMFNLIDSHDVSRLHNNPKVDFEVYKGAVITLFGLPGAVNIYYGDEKFLDGRIENNEGCRYPMDWSENLADHKQEIFKLYRTLSRLKTSNETLQDGGFRVIKAKDDLFAFIRFTDQEAFVFVWSRSTSISEVKVKLGRFGLKDAQPSIITGPAIVSSKKDKSVITLAPKGGCLIKYSL